MNDIIRQLIKPKIMPYGFQLIYIGYKKPALFNEVLAWTKDNFGKFDDKKWAYRDNSWRRKCLLNIYFSEEVNAIAFKLRWL